MPLLTTQSAKGYGFNALVTPVENNSFESIVTLSGTGSNANVTFTSIPQTYKHLQLRIFMNSTRSSGPTGSGRMQFNSDTTGTNYYTHSSYGGYTGDTAGFAANENYGVWWYGDATPIYVSAIIDILDYTDTNKKTTVREFTGFNSNAGGYMGITSMFWNNTAAVTQILLNTDGFNWGANARFALYGLKG